MLNLLSFPVASCRDPIPIELKMSTQARRRPKDAFGVISPTIGYRVHLQADSDTDCSELPVIGVRRTPIPRQSRQLPPDPIPIELRVPVPQGGVRRTPSASFLLAMYF